MTKKEKQQVVNHVCMLAIDSLNATPGRPENVKRLNKCQACFYQIGEFIVLESYNTVVAFYDTVNNCFFDVLRYVYGYTATSAQHISKFKYLCRIQYQPYLRTDMQEYRYYPV